MPFRTHLYHSECHCKKKFTLLGQKETSIDEHLVRRQSMTTFCFQSDLQDVATGQNLIGYLPGKS